MKTPQIIPGTEETATATPVVPEVAPATTPTEIPAEAPAPEEAETAPATSGALAEMITRFFPDQDVSTPEGLMAGSEKLITALVPIVDKLTDLAETAPEVADFLGSLIETADIAISLNKTFDPDELQALIEELKDSSYDDARNSYQEKKTSQKKRKEEVEGNIKLSLQEMEAYIEEKRPDWPDEKIDAFLDFVKDHYSQGWDGKIGKQSLLALEKAFTHDEDVDDAATTATIAARNEKIQKGKQSRKDLDLLPEISAGSRTIQKEKKEENPFMAGLREIANRKPVL